MTELKQRVKCFIRSDVKLERQSMSLCARLLRWLGCLIISWNHEIFHNFVYMLKKWLVTSLCPMCKMLYREWCHFRTSINVNPISDLGGGCKECATPTSRTMHVPYFQYLMWNVLCCWPAVPSANINNFSLPGKNYLVRPSDLKDSINWIATMCFDLFFQTSLEHCWSERFRNYYWDMEFRRDCTSLSVQDWLEDNNFSTQTREKLDKFFFSVPSRQKASEFVL